MVPRVLCFYNWDGCATIRGKMNYPRLVLASQSPRRRELLQLLGLPFEVSISDVVETARLGETPAELVVRLSLAKATGVNLNGNTRVLTVGCDTVVTLEYGDGDTRILGKPGNAEEAGAMLRALRGRFHVVYSAVSTWEPAVGATTDVAKTCLRMRNYTDAELAEYVTSGDPLDKAGAYAIQHEGFHPVTEIEGCYASVMGLPLCHLARALRRRGCLPVANVPTACQAYTGHQCNVYQEILSP